MNTPTHLSSIGKLLTGVTLLFTSVAATASSLTLDQKIGGTGTLGQNDFLQATFTDYADDTVLLTLDATHLTTGNIDSWYFNSRIDTTDFVISFFPSFSTGLVFNRKDSIEHSPDCCSPAPRKAGMFDLYFNFKNGGAANKRFGAGDTAVFQIYSVGLTADSFLANSTGGNDGSFASAAHILDISNGGEDIKIGAAAFPAPVPLPGAVWLLGSALAACGVFGRRASPLGA